MKVMTIMGTRPEIIRLSRVIPLLDESCDHVLLHTGQNFHPKLREVFFKELGVREPDHSFSCNATTPMEQIGTILKDVEGALLQEKPDRMLILGDTNSALSAFVAKRHSVRVFHMEAGNRCYDDRVPEEINRRIIDHSSDVLMPYTERSRANLLREGIHGSRIYVTGNPILEVLEHYDEGVIASDVIERLQLQKGHYFLATLHRAENVDEPERLSDFITAFSSLCERYDIPLVWSMHPRTLDRINCMGIRLHDKIVVTEPLGLLDFVKLEKGALCVLTDSGTVQEECCIFRIRNVTLRDTTERPETIEVGSNILSGSNPEAIWRSVEIALSRKCDWNPPKEYLERNVSETVRNIVLGY